MQQNLPEYYVMDRDQGMAAMVAPHLPAAGAAWLTNSELAAYAGEFSRTGFQGGLNWYRCRTEGRNAELEVFAGRQVEVPAIFLAGRKDWGLNQVPGALAAMRAACPVMGPPVVVDGVGHWVQPERPAAVVAALVDLVHQSNVRRPSLEPGQR